MKNLSYQAIVLSFLMVLPIGLWSQITVLTSFDPPFPPNQFPLDYQAWLSGDQDIIFTVNNPGPSIMVSFEVTISYQGAIVLGIISCDSFLLPQGVTVYDRDNPPPTGLCFDPHPENIDIAGIITSGVLPTGGWEVCFLVKWNVGGVEFQTGPPCSEITVEAIGYQPPSIVMPTDGQVFPFGGAIQFFWTPVTPSIGYLQESVLQIYEVSPTQDAIQAIRSNLPLVEQTVVGSTIWFWPPTSMQVMPGDCLHYVCIVLPQAPVAILDYPNGGSSEQVEFYIQDPRPRIPPYVAPCDSIDIGPDLVREGPQAPPVRIGCPSKPGHTYEWVSDKGNYHAFQSYVNVQPQVTTRYVLFQTDPTGTCVVRDEVWIQVQGAFTVNLAVSPCGVIQPSLLTLPSSGATVRTTVAGVSGSGPARGDTALIINGKAYDANGNLIGGGPAPIDPCTQPLPPPRTTGPTSNATYVWSTGETTPSIHPSNAGTYTCTVTDGQYSAVGSIDYTPSERFHGEFTELVYPIEVRQGDPQRALVIRQKGNEDGAQAAYNAMDYQVLINGPDGYQDKIKGSTTAGFADGEIRWDGGPDPSGVIATPGDYTATITLLNCSSPTPSDNRKYRLSHVKDATVPVDQATGRSRDMTFEFKVKKARQSPQASDI